MSAAPKALLRTLSPALRNLERSLRTWLMAPKRMPPTMLGRSTLEGLAADLLRQSEALDVERPLLVVMLMGGTGVGKSSLLNALAGGSIANASFKRPTTLDPVVYVHESVRLDRLDPALRHCRIVAHDRGELEHKILVDTPDVDSNDLTNRDKLLRLIPVADVVLYVGSQEKYHDQIVWDIFVQQRQRRAFAFVLNKWDRCSAASATGVRPDADLIADLESEGFENPRLFRTVAQHHIDATKGVEGLAPLPEGEQFGELQSWIETGLSKLEIEAIKARGVGQLLDHLEHALAEASPPELGETVSRVVSAWKKPLAEESTTVGDVLVNSLEPFQREIEHHFAIEGQRRFRGMMAWYLQMVTSARHVGSNLRERMPFVSRSTKEPAPAAWDLALFTNACSDIAGNRQLDARNRALANRLQVEADAQGFPLAVLAEPLETVSKGDWRKRWAQALSEVLQQVEAEWTRPTGARRVMQGALVFLADWLPPVALLSSLVVVLWRMFAPAGGQGRFDVWDFAIPVFVLVSVFVLLHVLIHLLLPLRWSAIRDTFHTSLETRVREELEAAYLAVPAEQAAVLRQERAAVEKLAEETREVASWLATTERHAGIASLYGSTRKG